MAEAKQAEGYEYMTLAEAAQQASLTTSTLKQQIRNNRLQAIKRGKQWFTRQDWLQEYLTSRQKPGGPGVGGRQSG